MGIGKNLGYTKDVFFRNKGFANHLNVLGGEDDLFVNEVAGKANTAVALEKKSIMECTAPINFIEWFSKKKLQLSTVRYYDKKSRFRILTEYFSRLLFYGAAIYLMTDPNWIWISAVALFLAIVVKTIIIKLNMMRLQEKDLLLPSLLMDPLMPFVLGIIRIANVLRPRRPKWN